VKRPRQASFGFLEALIDRDLKSRASFCLLRSAEKLKVRYVES